MNTLCSIQFSVNWSNWCEIISKRAGPNKRAGRNFLKKLINEQGQIRASRMEKPQIINKRACSLIRHLRVHTYKPSSFFISMSLPSCSVTIFSREGKCRKSHCCKLCCQSWGEKKVATTHWPYFRLSQNFNSRRFSNAAKLALRQGASCAPRRIIFLFLWRRQWSCPHTFMIQLCAFISFFMTA